MQAVVQRLDSIVLRLWHRLLMTWQEERGQSMVEYAVVTALIAAAAIAALTGFGESVKGAFDAIVKKIPAGGGGPTS
jgi:Flp pilus assembly pilin Flp